MEKMAFSEVYIGHLGLVTCLFLKASAPDNEYRIFWGVDERGLLCGYCSLTERSLARNGNGATLILVYSYGEFFREGGRSPCPI